MTTKEKNGMVREIYRIIAASGITSHIYKDDNWDKVFVLREIANNTIKLYCGRLNIYDDIRCIIEGIETCDTCKRYNVSIEDAVSGEVYGGGQIVAAFAGGIEQPWNAYDVCATWWTK